MRKYVAIGHGVELSIVLCSRSCQTRAVHCVAFGGETFTVGPDDGIAGVFVAHKHSDGSLCEGFVQWCLGCADSKDHIWTLIKSEPLSLSPSVLSHACGLHGYIVNGSWTLC